MSKRSNFERKKNDFYPTPIDAVRPLVPHISGYKTFIEPCAGDGALSNHIFNLAGLNCLGRSDICPQALGIKRKDALLIRHCEADLIITNPPWPAPNKKGEPVLSLISHLSNLAPLWLLLPADFKHNKYFANIGDRCRKIVSVGRVKWEPDSKHTGKDNSAWYLFTKPAVERPTFHWQGADK